VPNPYATFMRPAAPFVLVRLAQTVGPLTSDTVLAQLDTGADRTVIPGEFLEQLELARSGATYVVGYAGHELEAPIYDLRLTVAGFDAVAVEVLVRSDEPWVLLGRDVLNRYRIVLDGPNQTLEIS